MPLAAKREKVLFDVAGHDVVVRLQRGDGRDPLDPLHLDHVEVRYANVTNLAFLLELGQCLPTFFNLGIGPVDLVEIDRIHAQAPQAGFEFAAHGGSFQAVPDLALVIPHQAALGKDVRTVGAPRERFADDLFRVPESVHERGIDPVDAGIERGVNRCHRFIVLLPSPGESPVAAAHCPCANTDGSDFQVGVA